MFSKNLLLEDVEVPQKEEEDKAFNKTFGGFKKGIGL